MANTAQSNTSNDISKNEVIRALRLSPSREKIAMFETGRAYEIAQKLKAEYGTKKITVLVIK